MMIVALPFPDKDRMHDSEAIDGRRSGGEVH